MGLRTPNLAGEDRRSTLEEREPEAAVHLLIKHIKRGGPGDQTKAGAAEGKGDNSVSVVYAALRHPE